MRHLSASASLLIAALLQSAALGAEPESSPPSYTFHMDVAMAMRHFPWLHFNMSGVGEYEPGQSYDVRFTKVPWFLPKQQSNIDLSMLDPLMWPSRFEYVETGQQNDTTLYELHSLKTTSLENAIVALGPKGGASWVNATYNDGTTIDMKVKCSNVNGFMLPAGLSAEIDEPHLALSADAAFEDYSFAATPAH
jgi:hypothetical protein